MMWEQHVRNPHAPVDVDAISETAAATFDDIIYGGPRRVDLRGLDPASVQGEHLATVLRVTSSWRDVVPGWHEAFRVAEQALGDLAPDALYGLT